MKVLVIRKRDILILITIIFMVLIYKHINLFTNKAIPVSYLPISNKIVVIDPGHGGVDPGAVGKSGVLEDEVNLKIGLNLKRLIEQSGGIVIMTRETDKGLYTKESKTLRQMKTEDLRNRKKLVEDSNGDVFISIHLNSFTRPNYYGAQVFYRTGSKVGEELALIIQNELRNTLDKDNTRVPQFTEDIYLLNEVSMPAILVECGFLSNEREERLLNDKEYQEKIAWALYIGIMNFFNN